MRKRAHEIVEVATPGDRASQSFDIFLVTLITANAVALVVGTVESIYQEAPLFFRLLELVSVVVFSAEYAVRVWASVEDPRYSSPVLGRLRFALTPLMLVDLLAIAPFYLPLLGIDLRALRAIRLVFRVARLGRYFSGVRTLGLVLRAKQAELATVVIVLGVLLLVASSLMFFAEHEAQPDKFANIPAAMWWSIITLTTVGYGDVFPVTGFGRVIAGLIAILGIGLFALPAGILGSGFLEEINNRRRNPRICPHCGQEIGE